MPAWKSFLYSEIWKITEYRNGAIFKTKKTPYHITNSDIDHLPNDFIPVAISYTDPNEQIEINLIVDMEKLKNV